VYTEKIILIISRHMVECILVRSNHRIFDFMIGFDIL